MNNAKTFLPKENEIQRKWHLIDADGKVLGRLATQVADILRGKKKTLYCNHLDCGDFVVLINASKVVLTGNKLEQKTAFRHSGYVGGTTFTPYKKLMAETPDKAVVMAVKGMLPKNKLADRQITRLKVYRDGVHPHAAQFTKKADKESK